MGYSERHAARQASCDWRHPGLVRIHLDTDLGGDTDDACALAMLLGWPGVELVGITTTADPGGMRRTHWAQATNSVSHRGLHLQPQSAA
jgi:hypothetical protein